MNAHGRSLWVGWVIGACSVWLLAATAPAHAQKAKVTFRGTEIFSNQLSGFGLEPLANVGELAKVDPADTLIIVFGDLEVLDDIRKVTGGLAKFQQRGGAMLIASDRNDHGRLKDLKLRIGDKYWLECGPKNPEYAYRNDLKFLFMPKPDELHHPLFLAMNKGLATNHPSTLTLFADCDYQQLYSYPNAQYQTAKDGQFPQGEVPFIVGTSNISGPEERVVIIPGHGMFMNGLMAQEDNDNRAFANNCIRWLTNLGERKKVLFVVEDRIVTKLDLPLAQPPIPPIALLNAVLHALEKANLFNALLLDLIPKNTLLRWQLGIGSVILVVLVLNRLRRGRWPLALGPLLRRCVAVLQKRPALIVQRHRATLAQGNLWEAAHLLARQCFEDAALRPPPAPPHALRGTADQRQRLEAIVRQLWQLAYGPTARPILLPEFARLLQYLDQVQAALADGTLLYPALILPASSRP